MPGIDKCNTCDAPVTVHSAFPENQLCRPCRLRRDADRYIEQYLTADRVPDLHGVKRSPPGVNPLFDGKTTIRRAVLVGPWADVAPIIVRASTMYTWDRWRAHWLTLSAGPVYVTTDTQLREAYFREAPRPRWDDDPRHAAPLSPFQEIVQNPAVLVIRLGHYIQNNPALPGIIHEAITTRDRIVNAKNLCTWICIEPVQPWGKTHKCFSIELDAVLKEHYPTITIKPGTCTAATVPTPKTSDVDPDKVIADALGL